MTYLYYCPVVEWDLVIDDRYTAAAGMRRIYDMCAICVDNLFYRYNFDGALLTYGEGKKINPHTVNELINFFLSLVIN